jgi:hypothetical protein
MLPDFKNAHFCWMTVFGEVVSASKELTEWMKAEQPRVSEFKTQKGNGHIRLILVGGSDSENHVHIDIFAAGIAPKDIVDDSQVAQLNAIQESLERLVGKTIDTNIEAGFKATFNELPESGIIRSMFFKTQMGDVAIKSNGAKLLIEGAPVQQLTWYAPDANHIHVSVEAESIKKDMSDDYLTSASIAMEQAFNVFVMGKAQNDAK